MKTLMTLLACCVVGCAVPPSEDTASAELSNDDPSAGPQVSWQAGAGRADDALAPVGGGAETNAQNCVFIEFCNAPGGEGTVCRVRSSCLNQCFNFPRGPSGLAKVLEDECTGDANFVCGGITQPAIIKNC